MNEILEETSLSLRLGNIIALPTDTIYGIACSINSNEGIKKLYQIKRRNLKNPIGICVAEIEDMQKYVNIATIRYLVFLKEKQYTLLKL